MARDGADTPRRLTKRFSDWSGNFMAALGDSGENWESGPNFEVFHPCKFGKLEQFWRSRALRSLTRRNGWPRGLNWPKENF